MDTDNEKKPLRVVFCTVPERAAKRLARTLVEHGLAACVNIVPRLVSIYRWQSEVCEEGEALLIIKTTAERIEDLTKTIVHLHEYEVPEVIALAIEVGEGNHAYLDWLVANVGDDISQE